jgi:hypothetical protein
MPNLRIVERTLAEINSIDFNLFAAQFLFIVMKCLTHNFEAVGICAYCGRAVCNECSKSSLPRLVCSDNCAAALARDDQAMQLILKKSLQSARASAFYSFLCAVLSGAGAIGAYYYLPSPFLIWFTTGCAIVFMASGIWFSVVGKREL